MFDQLFHSSSEPTSSSPNYRSSRKGVIIGAGQVGIACAYSMLIQNTLDEMVLIDIDRRKLEGEVMDLMHGLPFVEPTLIRSGSLDDGDADGANLVIVTAGAKQKPGETRLDLVHRNVEIFKGLIPEVARRCPDAILLIVSNPVDVMSYVSWQLSGFPPSRVIGSGTLLDTARFRSLLAQKLHLDPRSLHAYIIGEHGDSEVPVWSKVNISGVNLRDGCVDEGSEGVVLDQVFDQVKNAAYEIIERKGATSYAIGLGVTQMAQAILRDQNRVLTVSTFLSHTHGLDDVYLSLPAVVGGQGVVRVLNLMLSSDEEQQLQKSGQILRQTIEKLRL